MARSSPGVISPARPELLWLHPDQIHPNQWNPNVVPKDVLEKVRESLLTYGWLAPVVVRKDVTGWQLVDGEHRWQVAAEEQIDEIPAFDVKDLSDADAKKLTVVLNDLHGQARPDLLANLFRDLLSEQSLQELTVALPYTSEMVASLLPELELPSLPVGPLPAQSPPGPRWVERTYRLPPDAAEVLDEAMKLAKGEDDVEPWQCLERIAAEFLAG